MENSDNIYDHLKEYADLSGHIGFAENLIKKYPWDDRSRQSLEAQILRIHDKQKDRCLNLSVIGEFSTGKSSFINALLGVELLVSSVIQGTTVVNTIIEHYSEPVLYVLRTDGTYEVIQTSSIKELSEKLSHVTTDPETARTIRLVRVGFPSELLASGIRIIDTPGTNSTESWHEDVTRDALKHLSDLSIVLVDAIHPMPKTLVEFLLENIPYTMKHTAFILTYYDMLRPSERAKTVEYVEMRARNELEIPVAHVLPYVSPTVLAAKQGEPLTAKDEEMVRISEESYSKLVKLMATHRQISQVKKLLTLTREAFDLLESNMNTKKTELENEHQRLLKSRQTSLTPFITSEKARSVSNFNIKAKDIEDSLRDILDVELKKTKDAIHLAVMNCTHLNANNIKEYIEKTVPEELGKQGDRVIAETQDQYKKLEKEFRAIMKAYQKDFEKQFTSLKIIKVNMGSIHVEIPTVMPVPKDTMTGLLSYMEEEVSKENWAIGGLGVTGAAIGTMIAPGIGTVIGGLFGAFFGACTTPTSDEIKKNAWNKLSSKIDIALRTLESDILDTFNANVAAYSKAITREIDRYLKKYNATVDRIIAEHESLIENNKRNAAQITTDLKLISLRREQLKSLATSLEK